MMSEEEKAKDLINTFGKELAIKVVREIIDNVIGGDWSAPNIGYWECVEINILNYD